MSARWKDEGTAFAGPLKEGQPANGAAVQSRGSRKAGRPAFAPTAEQRELVKDLAGLGARQVEICRFIEFEGRSIGVTTLQKYFDEELTVGYVEANAKVAQSLFQLATGGNVAACIFWLKSRAGWRESPQTHELTGPHGEPLQAPAPPSFIVNFVESSTPAAGDGTGDY